MEKKSKKELLLVIEEQDQNLLKYKSRLHDIVGSYKNLLKEKETLELSVQTLTAADSSVSEEGAPNVNEGDNNAEVPKENKNDARLQQLKSSIGALTAEKSRVENELRADRKNILQQKEELEKRLLESENNCLAEREKYENIILELKKKVTVQQHEHEKEEQNHALMLKELQNVLANERAAKERFEQAVCDLQQREKNKVSERKVSEYEKSIEELQNKLTMCQNRLQTSENEAKKSANIFQKYKNEMDELKLQYLNKIEEEKSRANLIEEKSRLFTFVKEKRIATLESRVSELSTVVGNHDKLRQQDKLIIQDLRSKISQRQGDHSNYNQVSNEGGFLWYPGHKANRDLPSSSGGCNVLKSASENLQSHEMEKDLVSEKIHAPCQAEIFRLKEELEQYKIKADSALKERYSKASAALLLDAKAGKEIKELKSKLTQLQDQLEIYKAKLKLNEEYHNKIATNLEKSCDDLKLQHKQEIAQVELSYRTQLLELEHQIQKQRERTLSLLEEKDKEISLLKTSFLSPFIKKDPVYQNPILQEKIETPVTDKDSASTLLSSSLISSQKDGHILHYIQELSRKDVEISNLRQSRIQTETTLRKLQQALAVMEEQYANEVEVLKSRVKLLESSQNEEGTNVEYLKNVVLGFLKCSDPGSRRHMVNAIATVLHFTSSEVQDVKEFLQ